MKFSEDKFCLYHILSFNFFVFKINVRNKTMLQIFSALKCVYLELPTGKNRKSGGISVNTPRVNFCIAMAPAFRSRLGHLDLKIFARFYFQSKPWEAGQLFRGTIKFLNFECYTLGCNICIKSEKLTFGHIMKFLKFFLFTYP